MTIELYLLLFSLYILIAGLFLHRLTNLWLWSSLGLSVGGFLFFFSGFKNLTPFDFFYTLNLGVLFFSTLLGGVIRSVLDRRSTLGRDFTVWLGLVGLAYSVSAVFVGDFSTVMVNTVESYLAGTATGGGLYHDLKLLTLVLILTVFIAVYHRGVNLYEYDYIVLILLGGLASLLLLTQDNLILVYLDLEFQALTLYVLTTYYRFEESNTEAGLKYLLLGSLISGFFLVGVFIFYFYNGTLNLSELTFIEGQTWFFTTFVFKLGGAPFYFWTPSVYQRMDYPSLIFISTVPKLSIWFLIFKNFHLLTLAGSFLYPAGLLSIAIGGLGGLYQLSLSSLIAYSGVLNTGYLMLFCDQADHGGVVFMVGVYLAGYYLVLGAVLAGFSFFESNFITGLPSLKLVGGGFSLVVYYFFLSLGGLPVLPGFSAKIFLLGYAVERNFFESFLIVFFSLFAVVYYLRVSGFFLFNLTRPAPVRYRVNLLYYFFLIVFFNSVGQSLAGW